MFSCRSRDRFFAVLDPIFPQTATATTKVEQRSEAAHQNPADGEIATRNYFVDMHGRNKACISVMASRRPPQTPPVIIDQVTGLALAHA